VLGYGWMIRPLKVAPLLAGMVTLQVILGIATLLTQVQIILASLHQAGAIILLGLMVTALYQTRAQK
jgi:heme A synthase